MEVSRGEIASSNSPHSLHPIFSDFVFTKKEDIHLHMILNPKSDTTVFVDLFYETVSIGPVTVSDFDPIRIPHLVASARAPGNASMVQGRSSKIFSLPLEGYRR